MVIATRSEYKGHPVLEIKWMEDDPYPIRYGIRKWGLILASIDEIKKFVEENKKE